jgi:hypothetical protein
MPDLDNRNPPDNLKLKAFAARAWARARLWRDSAFGDNRDARALHTAVDDLQRQAVTSGLLAEVGQDTVQAIMAAAFKEFREGPFGDLSPDDTAPPAARRPSESCPLGLCVNGVCADPGFCAGARAADVQADAKRARQTASAARPQGTPQTTIEAIMYAVRSRGLGALKEKDTLERLSRCDERAVREINQRIDALKAKGKLP